MWFARTYIRGKKVAIAVANSWVLMGKVKGPKGKNGRVVAGQLAHKQPGTLLKEAAAIFLHQDHGTWAPKVSNWASCCSLRSAMQCGPGGTDCGVCSKI